MNQDDLSYVTFGDIEGLQRFQFENYLQHQLFYQALSLRGVSTPFYPIEDIDPANIDDWLLIHNQMHENLATTLNLSAPSPLPHGSSSTPAEEACVGSVLVVAREAKDSARGATTRTPCGKSPTVHYPLHGQFLARSGFPRSGSSPKP